MNVQFWRIFGLCLLFLFIWLWSLKWLSGKIERQKNENTFLPGETKVFHHYFNHWYSLHSTNTLRVLDSIKIPAPQRVDTAAIIKRFYTQFTYVDTLKDSNHVVILFCKVAENKLLSDSMRLNCKRHLEERIIYPAREEGKGKTMLFAGFSVNGNQNSFGFSPELLLIDAKKRAYGLSYDLLQHKTAIRLLFPVKFGKN